MFIYELIKACGVAFSSMLPYVSGATEAPGVGAGPRYQEYLKDFQKTSCAGEDQLCVCNVQSEFLSFLASL